MARLVPPTNDVTPYLLDKRTCLAIQANISSSMNAIILAANITMVDYFGVTSALCSDRSATTCGTFMDGNDTRRIQSQVDLLVPMWIEVTAGGSLCRPELEGYDVQVTSGSDSCLSFDNRQSCKLPPSPFFNCS